MEQLIREFKQYLNEDTTVSADRRSEQEASSAARKKAKQVEKQKRRREQTKNLPKSISRRKKRPINEIDIENINQIATDNITWLVSVANKGEIGNSTLENFILENFEIFIEYISILSQSKIMEVAGSGTQGFVVYLDNGHALKLAMGSYNSIEEEIEIYGSMMDSIFSKKGTTADLPVYDYGSAMTEDDEPFYWAEMPRIITLADLLERTERDSGNTVDSFLLNCKNMIRLVLKKGGNSQKFVEVLLKSNMSDEKLKRILIKKFDGYDVMKLVSLREDFEQAELTIPEAIGLTKAIERKIKLGHPVSDLADYNIGVFEGSPTNFVFFDV